MKKIIMLSAIFTFSLSFPAFAQQGYVIQRPGQTPTYVNPSGNGGYVLQTPGQTPSYANPSGNGGFVVQTPGQTPTYINPVPGQRIQQRCLLCDDDD